ncbi:MAG TPA: hypothetical protein VEC35_14385 [Noviherbaspirillum sp.]|nr:hypothetical protein [Noviherbaspirillum sp.]
MIIRLWVTGLFPSRAENYDKFANSRSLHMFRTLDGCEGVLFIRSETQGYVFSFWRDVDAIEALSKSDLYQQTVKEIVAAGFLSEPQTVELVNVTGGFLAHNAMQFLRSLSIDLGAQEIRLVGEPR